MCGAFSSIYQAPGYKVEFTFQVRLDQQVSNARGSAVLAESAGPDEGRPAGRFAWDTSTDGNNAPIVGGSVAALVVGAGALTVSRRRRTAAQG